MEEKLLNLQRYHERQKKGTDNSISSSHQPHHTPITTTPRAPARKRPAPSPNIPLTTTVSNLPNVPNNKDSEWTEPPKKKPPPRQDHRETAKLVESFYLN